MFLPAQAPVTLPQVPRAVQNGSAQLVGPMDAQQMLRVTFALKTPHAEQEEQFLLQLQDPHSPQYHQYLSPEQWIERFSPSPEDEQSILTWVQSQGLTVTMRFPNRLLVEVQGTVSVLDKAFDININNYKIGDKTYFSNDRGPTIPNSLGDMVQHIFGLNNIQVMHHLSRNKLPEADSPIYSPGPAYAKAGNLRLDGNLGKWQAISKKKPRTFETYGLYDPNDLYSSYFYNYQPLQGLGHCCNPLGNPGQSPPQSSIAVAIWGDYADSDMQMWAGYYGLSVNTQRILIGGAQQCNVPPAYLTCDGEATLDTEYTTAMANSFSSSSNTATVYVYEGYSSEAIATVLNRILTDGYVRVVNMSWGESERDAIDDGTLSSFSSIFRSMVGQGFTLVAASGDGGATADCLTDSVNFPAADPHVTATGGTTLISSQGFYSSETGWQGGPDGCAQNDGGSGGGCSVYFAAPAYQPSACNGMRSVPDIALNADGINAPQALIYQGQFYEVGGTSVGSPEMAGFFAQENAYLLYIQSLVGNTCGPSLSAPCSPVGFANPILYAEGVSPFAPHYPFYDITQGCNNNDITQEENLPFFCARLGYDQVTGWGSANMFQLAWMVNDLMAGDGGGPQISITGPPVNRWYNVDQTINFTLTDTSANGRQPIGVAGYSEVWDADPGDPYSQSTPGGGSSYYGLGGYGSSGIANGLANQSQGCHNAFVRAWDNAGNSNLATYGALCFDNIPPVTAINLSGNGGNGNYSGPVLVALSATDNASGVAATYYSVDFGPFQNYGGSFYSYLPGGHCVEAYSVDVAGNQEGDELNCFNITQNTQFTLTVTKSGTGSGTVISSDGAINCGTVCSAPYYDEQPVTLTASPAQGSIFTGWRGCGLSFGFSCTLTVTSAQTVTAVFNVPIALRFVPLTPCRVVDTRQANGQFGGPAITGGTSRDFALPQGACPGIPSNAAAYSVNVTVVPQGHLGYLTTWPTGYTRPLTSLMNSDGRTKANAAIVPAGDSSSVSVYVTDTANVIIDINGYFTTPGGNTLAFFPMTPCRVVDTRGADGTLGGPILSNGVARDFPIQQSTNCPVPASAQAYSFNVTALPQNQQRLSYLTVWPTGISQPVVSTLNSSTGVNTANAAIVPAGTDGDIDVYPSGNNTNLIIDINGYFAPPATGSLSLYTFEPCRVLDTRQGNGAFSGQMVVNVANSGCGVPTSAQGYDMNATVVPSGALGYLTLWPDGENQPVVSTLNAPDGAITSNMAIVPTTNGSIDAYASALTQLILDISSYFAP
jgi:hypothetical protein